MNQDEKTNAIKYMEIAQLAYDTAHEIMRQGEADGKAGWETLGYVECLRRARAHIANALLSPQRFTSEEIRQTVCYVAMAYYLWLQEQEDEQQENAE